MPPPRGGERLTKPDCVFISHKVFIKSFRKSQFPHKSVNLFFILLMIKEKSTEFCGNCLLQNDFMNTSCEIECSTLFTDHRRWWVQPAPLKSSILIVAHLQGAKTLSSEISFCAPTQGTPWHYQQSVRWNLPGGGNLSSLAHTWTRA